MRNISHFRLQGQTHGLLIVLPPHPLRPCSLLRPRSPGIKWDGLKAIHRVVLRAWGWVRCTRTHPAAHPSPFTVHTPSPLPSYPLPAPIHTLARPTAVPHMRARSRPCPRPRPCTNSPHPCWSQRPRPHQHQLPAPAPAPRTSSSSPHQLQLPAYAQPARPHPARTPMPIPARQLPLQLHAHARQLHAHAHARTLHAPTPYAHPLRPLHRACRFPAQIHTHASMSVHQHTPCAHARSLCPLHPPVPSPPAARMHVRASFTPARCMHARAPALHPHPRTTQIQAHPHAARTHTCTPAQHPDPCTSTLPASSPPMHSSHAHYPASAPAHCLSPCPRVARPHTCAAHPHPPPRAHTRGPAHSLHPCRPHTCVRQLLATPALTPAPGPGRAASSHASWQHHIAHS
ncbi:hypothetical protein FIBSPDRAFT_942673 [Athelia psychrophila]|uniref:Uncharacterized protein n=1 Tax=Athelia psychrophila TaxID=1759441 RepID=A0A166X9M6_9AGAM|nr:hypothetical protein FIBSPDRAFT_942673 [Fibularhizoctonia sp. CBS 109695]